MDYVGFFIYVVIICHHYHFLQHMYTNGVYYPHCVCQHKNLICQLISFIWGVRLCIDKKQKLLTLVYCIVFLTVNVGRSPISYSSLHVYFSSVVYRLASEHCVRPTWGREAKQNLADRRLHRLHRVHSQQSLCSHCTL